MSSPPDFFQTEISYFVKQVNVTRPWSERRMRPTQARIFAIDWPGCGERAPNMSVLAGLCFSGKEKIITQIS